MWENAQNIEPAITAAARQCRCMTVQRWHVQCRKGLSEPGGPCRRCKVQVRAMEILQSARWNEDPIVAAFRRALVCAFMKHGLDTLLLPLSFVLVAGCASPSHDIQRAQSPNVAQTTPDTLTGQPPIVSYPPAPPPPAQVTNAPLSHREK